MRISAPSVVALLAVCACGGKGGADTPDAYNFMDAAGSGDSPIVGDCPLFPANNIFNTQIGSLPADAHSDAYIATISGTKKLHLDLGTTVDQASQEFYGIPFQT